MWIKISFYLLIILIFVHSCHQSEPTVTNQDFLERYWMRPLAPQGQPPPAFYSVEMALNPATCGKCHSAQWHDWQNSLHRRAMGAGVLGQLIHLPASAVEEQQTCLHCHAPLFEQAQSLTTLLSHTTTDLIEFPLHEQGVMCAVCHLREFQWYGPPHQEGSRPNLDSKQFPHNGWQSHPAFSDSQFCAACHQFKPDGYALNGKLLENTYKEWQQSRYSKEGVTCQKCHLPQRRHLWRGIHDPAMTKTGVEIQVQDFKVTSDQVTAQLKITNHGTGHFFPTYVTPKITVKIYQENQQGQLLSHTLKQEIIGWQVSIDLSEEIADTRLAPDEQRLFNYAMLKDAKAIALVFDIQVAPDAFYTEFYRTLLEQESADIDKTLIEQALEESQASIFTLYFKRLSFGKF